MGDLWREPVSLAGEAFVKASLKWVDDGCPPSGKAHLDELWNLCLAEAKETLDDATCGCWRCMGEPEPQNEYDALCACTLCIAMMEDS
jgi:hypothetical protein